MGARSPVQQQEVQIYEGDFLELEAEGQNIEFPDVTPPPSKRESDLKKELKALTGESEELQWEKTKRLKARNKKLKEPSGSQEGSYYFWSQNSAFNVHSYQDPRHISKRLEDAMQWEPHKELWYMQ